MDKEVELVRKRTNNEEKRNKKGFFFVLFNRRKGSRLGLLLFALFITGALMATSTYAWFTSNYSVSVSQLNINVAAGAGITISSNGVDWKAVLTNDDLYTSADGTKGYAGSPNFLSLTNNTNPVSTNGALDTSGKLTFYRGEIAADTTSGVMYLNTTAAPYGTTAVAGDFNVFDFFIKSDLSTGDPLYFTQNTGITASATGIEMASRFALIYYGKVENTNASIETLKALYDDSPEWERFYEPNWDIHSPNGITEATNTYKLGTAPNNAYTVPGAKAADALGYKGVVGVTSHTDGQADGVTLQNSYSDSSITADIASSVEWQTYPSTTAETFNDGASATASLANKRLFDSAHANSHTRYSNDYVALTLGSTPAIYVFRCYMWVEGQDIECENGASGGTLKLDLGFEVNK